MSRRRLAVLTCLMLGAATIASSPSSASAADPDEECTFPELLEARHITEALGVDELEEDGEEHEQRFGVTVSKADASRIDKFSSQRDDLNPDRVRTALMREYPESFVSAVWSYQRGLALVFRLEAPSENEVRQILDVAKVTSGELDVVTEVVGAEAITSVELQAGIETLNGLAGPRLAEAGIVEYGASERCGRLIIGHGPGQEGLTSRFLAGVGLEGAVLHPVAKSELPVHSSDDRDTYRNQQTGGLKVSAIGNTGVGCTSATPWYRNVPSPVGTIKQLFAVTAGHCVPQSTWASTPGDWNDQWWTLTTSPNNLGQPSTIIATGTAAIRYGAELDVAVWPLTTGMTADSKTAINRDGFNYRFKAHGWWQWDPTWETSTSGGDMVNDIVCQSGVTTSKKNLGPSSAQTFEECGELFTRTYAYTSQPAVGESTWLYHQRKANMRVCSGDSGGTVWRGAWYTGVVSTRSGDSGTTAGRLCGTQTTYGHIGYIRNAFALAAPVNMS